MEEEKEKGKKAERREREKERKVSRNERNKKHKIAMNSHPSTRTYYLIFTFTAWKLESYCENNLLSGRKSLTLAEIFNFLFNYPCPHFCMA